MQDITPRLSWAMETTNKKDKKKVIIFIPEFPGRTETFIEREVAALIKKGTLDITVFSLKKGSGSTSQDVTDKTVYKRLSLLGLIFGIFFGLTHLKKVYNLYKRIKNNPNRTFFQTKYLLLKAIGYSRILSKYNPDIIYAHFMSESSTLCYLSSELLACELGIAAHAKDILVTDSTKRSENAELVKQKVEKAKFVVICNRLAYDKATELSKGADTSHVYLMYHGVDFDELLKLDYPQIEKPDVPVIFTNGRFREKKGHKYLIDAAKIIKDRGFAFVMYILGGPGDLYDQTVSYIKEKGLENIVKIVGEGQGVSFNEVVSYYRISDVYVFPSINMQDGNADGISNTLIEASVFKVPIVATNSGSTLEFLSHENTALIVPQKNPYALADSIERLLFNSDLAEELAESAHNKAREMFDIHKNIESIEKLILR